MYQVGFDEDYKLVSFELPDEPVRSRAARLDSRVDVLRLFQSSATIDMAALPAVKFDRTDAALLARNFRRHDHADASRCALIEAPGAGTFQHTTIRRPMWDNVSIQASR